MNLKRILAVLLCLCLAVCIMLFAAACNKDNTNGEKPTSAPTQAPTDAPTDAPTEKPTETPTEDNTEKKVTYTVTVEDFDGEKVAGVTVQICKGEDVVASGNTDDKGKFVAQLVEADDYTAKIIKADGYIFDGEAVEFESETKLEFTVNKAVKYTFTVTDVFDGEKIEGVIIELYTSSGKLAACCTTNNEGIATVWAEELTYTVVLSSIPSNYDNSDAYLLESGTHELEITLLDPADYTFDGGDPSHALIVYHGYEVTVPAGGTIYCSAPRTSGNILRIAEAQGLKVIYQGVEYLPDEEGLIAVQFELQLDDEGNEIDKFYTLPNEFAVINTTGSSITKELSMLSPDDHGGTEANPFIIEIGALTTTPEYVIGTSLSDPGVSTYYYKYVATENGFFWIETLDAAITVFVNGVILSSENGDNIGYVLANAGDEINLHVYSMAGWSSTSPVSFTAYFDPEITEIPDKFTCEHEYDNDCDTKCNKCDTERLPTHTEEIIPEISATCSQTGLTAGVKCSVCGEILEAQKEIPTTAHTEGTVTGTEPTCTQTGLGDGKKCTVCGQITVEQAIIPELGHEWSTVYTSDANGHWKTCNRGCGETTDAQEHDLDENGLCACGYGCEHTSVVWSTKKEASCTETGLKVATCNECGLDIDSEIIGKKSHIRGEAATCTTDQTCISCGKVIVGAFGHTPGDAATCTKDQTCSTCGDILTPAKGHTPGDEATCTTDQICTVCGDVVKEAGHTPNRDEATCAYQKICIKCMTVLEPYKEHTPGDAATCTTAQVCTACGWTMNEALGHSYGGDDICTVCGATRPTYTYKITVLNAFDNIPMANVKLNIYDFETEDYIGYVITDENGYAEFITKLCATAIIGPTELPEGYSGETFLAGEESAFGFECTLKLVNEADYVYDGRDEAHPFNIALNDGKVTVEAGATMYCSYPRSAGLTLTINNASGIKVIYKGVEYTAKDGVITVKFDKQYDEEGNLVATNYSEPCVFTVVNTTGAAVTLTPVVR